MAKAGPAPFSSERAAVNPPKNARVMPSTRIPASLAVTAWASSWQNTDQKNRAAPKPPYTSATPESRSNRASNRAQRLYTARTAIQIHEESMFTGMPRIVAMRKERPNPLRAYPSRGRPHRHAIVWAAGEGGPLVISGHFHDTR